MNVVIIAGSKSKLTCSVLIKITRTRSISIKIKQINSIMDNILNIIFLPIALQNKIVPIKIAGAEIIAEQKQSRTAISLHPPTNPIAIRI